MNTPPSPPLPGAPPIVQYWHSSEVPPEVQVLIATFRDRNPDMRHLLVHEAEAADFIAEHFTSREVDAFRACAVPAMQADYFRYCAILVLGGVYADVGLICRRPLDSLVEEIDGGLLIKHPPRRVVSNAFYIFAAPGHPFLRLALDIATANIERQLVNAVNVVTGPWIFTVLAEVHRAGVLDSRLAPNPTAGRLAQAMLEEIGDYERVATAFQGIRLGDPTLQNEYVGPPDIRPAYKDSDTRWTLWPKHRGSIFR